MSGYVLRVQHQTKKPLPSKREAAFVRKAAEAVSSKKGNKRHDD